MVNKLRDHVLCCPRCTGQGHICQICRNTNDIIFPFDLENTSVCTGQLVDRGIIVHSNDICSLSIMFSFGVS